MIYHTTHQSIMPFLRKIRLIIRHNSDDIIKTAIGEGQKHSHFFRILRPFFVSRPQHLVAFLLFFILFHKWHHYYHFHICWVDNNDVHRAELAPGGHVIFPTESEYSFFNLVLTLPSNYIIYLKIWRYILYLNITVRRSRQSGVARATCPD